MLRGVVGSGVMAAVLALGACSSASEPATSGGGSGGAGAGGVGGGTGGGTGGLNLGGASGGGGAPNPDAGCNQALDIVFVMDVSTSMGPFLSKLGAEIATVDAAVKKLNLTSVPHYGLVVFVDDTMFVNSAQPYPDVTTLETDFKSWASFTSSNQQTNGGGQNTTWPENSMDALHRAAKEFAWRPLESTLRIVIHTTDDTFWQGPTTQDGVQIQQNYSTTSKALTDGQIRVFSFASKLGGPWETDDVSAGWFGPYQGAPALPTATGGQVYELADVVSGTISLSAAIPAAVKDTLCKPYPVPK